ncbi:MAG: caspase family protein [Geobacter sp.]|nr:caspase family protein [Geobacter sp.]
MFRRNLFVAVLVLTASILAWGAEDRSLTIRSKSAAIERRVALVIGNSSYADAPLKNPVNDADAMVAALKETGFEVVVRKNADRRAMFTAIKEFGQKLKKSDIGLFYYAGHGVQIDSANYLLPTDLRNSDLQDSDDLRRDAVALNDLMERMRDAGTRNIVILDACRDNPFLAKLSRGGSRGLAKIVTAANTSILYSTDPGNTASDGASGDNGVFTKHLVSTIRKDGLELVDVMREVSLSVDRETAGAQRPVFDGVLSTKFFFRPQQEMVAKLVAPPPSIGVDPKAIELRYWESAEQTRTISAYKKYLKKYPDGEFADMAIEKVQIMEAAEVKAKESVRSDVDQKAALAD